MFKEFEKITSNFKRIKNGKSVPYFRTATHAHFICDNCGSAFIRQVGGGVSTERCNNNFSHYCSDCPAFALAAEKGRKTKYKQRSKLIGKKTITSHGYVSVYIQDSHKYSKGYGGSIREHILVMENYLERGLEKGEVVHHIDFNKSNNDINNLDVMSVSEHNKCHGAAANALLVELFNANIIIYDKTTQRYIIKK